MERPVRIHLGSGRHCWPNAINVDYDERADIVGPVDALPDFPDGFADEIYAVHLFEHLDRLKIGEALAEWRRVLKQGGKLILEMPCLDKIAQMIVAGNENIRMTLFGIFGDINEPSIHMRHKWCYTKKEIQTVLEMCGFSVDVTDSIYHVPTRDMRATAVKL